MVLSEVAKRLMMMSGSDASTSAAKCDRVATSRINEVVTTTVPAGHHWPSEPGQELADRSGGAGLPPFTGSTVNPNADGELLKLGIEIGQTSVAKYMARRRPAIPGLEDVPPQSCRRHRGDGSVRAASSSRAAVLHELL
jgi:hypothetical protein